MAELYLESENNDDAEVLFKKLFNSQESILGEEHLDTLLSAGNLGLIYYKRGNAKQAKYFWNKAKSGYENILGFDHPDTLTIISNLKLLDN